MGKISKYFCILLVVTLAASCLIVLKPENATAQPSPAPSSSPVVHWKLDEGTGNTALDSSGNNYQGEIYGASWVSGVTNNSALEFNGVSDYVSVPSLPVTNIDSLTVVAWINSDFSQIGYIFYHGQGEFLLHNGERTKEGPVAGRYPYLASFSVKLAGPAWYDVYSSPLEPNTWHQLVGVWTKGTSLKIYVDGVLAGENDAIPSSYILNPGSHWLQSLGVYNRGEEADTYFKGLLDDVMVFDRALSAQEISSLYSAAELPSEQPPLSASSQISISAESLSTVAGSPVNVFGTLTDSNGSALQNKTIVLSYIFPGIDSWVPISSGLTDEQGNYALQWINSASGTFTLKAEWSGDENTAGASNQTSLSFLPYQNQQQNFIFESNSTIYDLGYDAEASSLTFNVTGASGTTGYTRATIAKSLLADSQNLQVSMDGEPIDYSVEPTADAWVFAFNYSHSTHQITLNFASTPALSAILVFIAGVAAVILCTVAVCLGLTFYARKIGNA